jgi:C4-type Zn-finger protein
MFEAAQIPVFAKFLRSSRSCDLCNYVSNSVRAARENMRKLGRIVNDTLNIDDESWF